MKGDYPYMFKKKNKKILNLFVVDDSFYVRKSIFEYLYKKPQNMEFPLYIDFVGEACLKRELVDQLPAIEADVFFLDMDLPDGTAWDLIDEIYEYLPEAIIIAMTDEKTIETQQLRTVYESKVLTILEKPFQPNHLYEAIEMAARQRFNISRPNQSTLEPKVRTRILFEPEETNQDIEETPSLYEKTSENQENLTLLTNQSIEKEPTFLFETELEDQAIVMSTNQHSSFESEDSSTLFSLNFDEGDTLINDTTSIHRQPLDEATTDWTLETDDDTPKQDVMSVDLSKEFSMEDSAAEEDLPFKFETTQPYLFEEEAISPLTAVNLSICLDVNEKETLPVHANTKDSKGIDSENEKTQAVSNLSNPSFILMEEVYDDEEFSSSPSQPTTSKVCLMEVSQEIGEDEAPLSNSKTEKNEENKEFDSILSSNLYFPIQNEEKNPQLNENFFYFEDNEEEIPQKISIELENDSEEEKNLLNEEKELLFYRESDSPLEAKEVGWVLKHEAPSDESDFFLDFSEPSVTSFVFNEVEEEEPSDQEELSTLIFDFETSSSKEETSNVEDFSEWTLDFKGEHSSESEKDSTSQTTIQLSMTENEYFTTDSGYTETSQRQPDENFCLESENHFDLSFSPQSFEFAGSSEINSSPTQVTTSREQVQSNAPVSQAPLMGSTSTDFVISPPRSKTMPGMPSNPKEFGRFGIRK